MEVLLLLLVKFYTVIYGAIYGTVASVPLVKEWIVRNRLRVSLQDGKMHIHNNGGRPLLLLDGCAVGSEGEIRLPREALLPDQTFTINLSDGEYWLWLKLVDLGSGKELVYSEKIASQPDITK